MPELQNALILLAVNLIKHQLRKTLGDDTLVILSEMMTGMVGDTFEEKLGTAFSNNDLEKNVLKAFEQADKDFLVKCTDQTLKDAIREQGLSVYQQLRKQGVEITKSLESESLQHDIYNQISKDWRGLLSDTQIKQMLEIYMTCLERALASQTGKILEIVFVKVSKTEKTSRQILEIVQSFDKKLEQLRDRLDYSTVSKNQTETNWMASESAEQTRIIIKQHTQLFIGRDKEFEQIDKIISRKTGGIILITAPAGYGKTTFISNWVQLQDQKEFFIACHFFTRKYSSTLEAYKNILRQLYEYFQPDNQEFPESELNLRNVIVWLISKYPKRPQKTLLIVVDAVDEADNIFSPLNIHSWPENVFFIATSRSYQNELPDFLIEWGNVAHHVKLDTLSKDDLLQWVSKVEALNTNSFIDLPEIINKIYSRTQGFPLYISFLIDELSRHHQQQQEQRIKEVLATIPQGFKEYVIQQIKAFDNLDLKPQIWKLLSLLSVARKPLTQEDLKSSILLGLQDRDLREIQYNWHLSRWLNIFESDGVTFYSFSHHLLAEAFSEFLGDDAKNAENVLFDYCSQWQNHKGRYALETYTGYLADKGRHNDLYTLLLDNPTWREVKYHILGSNNAYNDDLNLAINTISKTPNSTEIVILFSLYAAQQVVIAFSSEYSDDDLEILTQLEQPKQAISLAKQRNAQKNRFQGMLKIFNSVKDKGNDKTHLELFDDLIKSANSNPDAVDRLNQILETAIASRECGEELCNISFNDAYKALEEIGGDFRAYALFKLCRGLIFCNKLSEAYKLFKEAIDAPISKVRSKADQMLYAANIISKIPSDNPIFNQFHQVILNNLTYISDTPDSFHYFKELIKVYGSEGHIEQASSIIALQSKIEDKIEILFELVNTIPVSHQKNIFIRLYPSLAAQIQTIEDDNLLSKAACILMCNHEKEKSKDVLRKIKSSERIQEAKKSIAKAAIKHGDFNLFQTTIVEVENQEEAESLYYDYVISENSNVANIDIQRIKNPEKQKDAQRKFIVKLAKSGALDKALLLSESYSENIDDIRLEICKAELPNVPIEYILNLASSIKVLEKKADALLNISRHAIKKNRPDLAANSFSQARQLSIVINSTSPWLKAKALLVDIVEELHQDNSFVELDHLLNSANTISDEKERSIVLSTISIIAARKKRRDAALTIARDIPIYYHRMLCLKELAQIFGMDEDIGKLDETLDLIDIVSIKDDILRKISLTSGFSKKYGFAVDIAKQMSLDLKRFRTWADLSAILYKQDNIIHSEFALDRLLEEFYAFSFSSPEKMVMDPIPLLAALLRTAGTEKTLQILGELTDFLKPNEYFRILCYSYLEEGNYSKAISCLEELENNNAPTFHDYEAYVVKVIAESFAPELALSVAHTLKKEQGREIAISHIGRVFNKLRQLDKAEEAFVGTNNNNDISVIMNRIDSADYEALKILNINQLDEFLAFYLSCISKFESIKPNLGYEILLNILNQYSYYSSAWLQTYEWFLEIDPLKINKTNPYSIKELQVKINTKKEMQALLSYWKDEKMLAVFYFNKGLSELKNEKYLSAKQAFEEAILRYSHPIFNYYLGVSCYKLEEWLKAKTLLTTVSQYWPEDGLVNNFLGFTYFELGEIRNALQSFTKIVKNHPENYNILLKRAELYYLLDEMELALEDLYKFPLEPNWVSALEWKALINLNIGKFEVAKNCIDISLKMHSANSYMLYWRAIVNALLSDYSASLIDINASLTLELSPRDMSLTLFWRSIFHKLLGNLREANNDLLSAQRASEKEISTPLFSEIKMFSSALDGDLNNAKLHGSKLLNDTDWYGLAAKRTGLRSLAQLFPNNPILYELETWYSSQIRLKFARLERI